MPTYAKYKKINKGMKNGRRHKGYKHPNIPKDKILEMRCFDGWNYVVIDLPEISVIPIIDGKYNGQVIAKAEFDAMYNELKQRSSVIR